MWMSSVLCPYPSLIMEELLTIEWIGSMRLTLLVFIVFMVVDVVALIACILQ